jgi:hypothetical protein
MKKIMKKIKEKPIRNTNEKTKSRAIKMKMVKMRTQ